MQYAVDAQAHAPAMLRRLDVQVRRIAAGCLLQRVGQEAHGRRVVGIGETRIEVGTDTGVGRKAVVPGFGGAFAIEGDGPQRHRALKRTLHERPVMSRL